MKFRLTAVIVLALCLSNALPMRECGYWEILRRISKQTG